MSFLSRLSSLFALKQKTAVKLIALMSVIAFVANLTPELYRDVPSQADEGSGDVTAAAPPTPPTNNYILVDTLGNGNLATAATSCIVRLANAAYPTTTVTTGCHLDQAIKVVNDTPGTDTFTIAFHPLSFNPAPFHLDLTSLLPNIDRASGGPVILDGAMGGSNVMTLNDNTAGNNHLSHFFRISKSDTPQTVTIQNFAFSSLVMPGAAAITSDILSTTTHVDPADINSLNINHNYFGTRDGLTLVGSQAIWQAVKVYVPAGIVSNISITNNDIFNSVAGIEVGSSSDFNDKSCIGQASGLYNISDNIIGLNKNKAITDRNYSGPNIQGAWSLFGVKVCNLNRAEIKRNTIANSLGLLPLPDVGIDIQQSVHLVQDNDIGVVKNSDGTYATNFDWGIVGYGIRVIKNDEKSFIVNNNIANIFTILAPSAVNLYCTNIFQSIYDPTQADTNACGGTGINLYWVKNESIYNNTIGNEITPNLGYGIEILGGMGQNSSSSTVGGGANIEYQPSSSNEIFKNTLKYNLADGIQVRSISNLDPDNLAPTNQTCTTSQTSLDPLNPTTEVTTNNCENTLIQNSLVRNGPYNGANFCIESQCTGSPEGGIGIDLKRHNDATEQKYLTITAPYTGSGTTNDSDITENDTNDTDLGGNDVLNTPVLYGSGADESSMSTARTIRGNLSQSQNGRYWVEAFAVNCPAEFNSTTPTIAWANSATNCDTDSPSLDDQTDHKTFGQGFKFLCGAYVNKTTSPANWSCDPSDFGNTFAGGLVTSTVSSLTAPISSTGISSTASDPPPNTQPDTSVVLVTPTAPSVLIGFPGLTPLNAPRFSCEAITTYISRTSSTSGCVGQLDRFSPTTTDVILGTMLEQLTNTSEFSRNAFVPAADLGLTKTVRTCTGPLPADCAGETFSSSVSTEPGEYVEFRIEGLNNSEAPASSVNITDQLPSEFSWTSGTCNYFTNLSTAPTDRPSTGSLNCTSANDNQITVVPSTPLNGNQRITVYAIAQADGNAASGSYTNTALASAAGTSCTTTDRCEASATVQLTIPATASLIKTIESPDTNSNRDNETLNGPTAATTVNYQIKTEVTGVTKDNITSLIISDNFPRAISSTQNVDYSSNGCQITMQRNLGAASTAVPCDGLGSINSTNLNDLAIWHGASIAGTFPEFTENDRFTITITYRGIVPANPLLSSDATVTIINTAKFVGTGFATQSDSTTLTITPPTTQAPVPPTLHKQVRACTGTTADTCTGAFNETGISGVAPGSTVEYRLEATSNTGSTFAFKDPAPTGITFVTSANSCLVYSGLAQLSTSAARPTGGSPCTFDSTSGVQLINTNNQVITANQYAYVYALATVASTATGTITNTASLTGNGCTTALAQCSDPATVTIAVTTPGQVTIDKQVNPTAVTSSTTATQDVTYTIVLSKPNTFAINNATWTDTFPTTPVALSNYTCTSVTVLPAGSQTIACPTTFPPAGGTLFSGTINAAVTSITMTYTARVPVNAATTTAQSVTNSTTIAGTRSTDAVALSQTDTAVLTVNPNTGSNGGNTNVPVVSLSKRADNNVTSSDRALEKIYKPGDTVNYTLSLLNSGAVAATGVTLQDVFHSMLKSMTINALPTGATQSLTSTMFNFGNINVPTGTTPTTVTYHGTIADKSSFDLDLFDLKENSNPARDDDFYASKDSDIEDDIGNSNNSHKRAEDILGAPDDRFVSLGSDGEMTINLGTKVIVNGSGDDFALRTINNSVDDTDQSGEDLKVSVSQDGTTFKTINPRSTDEYRYDLSKAKMSWIRYIRLTDESSSVKAKAPGVDIDAICLLNIGVQLPNRVNMTIGTQSAFATEYVTVDVTKVFSKKPSIDNCSEPAPTPVIQQELPPPPPAPLPPAPVYVPAPTPPALPKTGAEPLVLISVVSSLAWVFTTRKKK